MKVGIYNEPAAGLGGSEYLTAVMAHTLARRHDVEVLHHSAGLSAGDLSNHSGLDLHRLPVRYVPREPNDAVQSRGRWRAHRAVWSWQRRLSESYDLFIAVTHGIPPVCHARAGALLVLFPAFDRAAVWPWSVGTAHKVSLAARLRRAYHTWDWERRFGSYQVKASISRFAQQWT
ncbi:MAG: hypothetical protein WKG32_05955, partial [Gemmatimonadaceae bacterium]